MGNVLYKTKFGKMYAGNCESVLQDLGKKDGIKGAVQLIITSPPFPLNKKKNYGNKQGDEYLKWIESLAPLFCELLSETGSIVLELGNGWEPGRPIQSLLSIKALLAFLENPDVDLRLCQEFICYNPARLPSPAEWVTVKRIRAIDSFTHIWWMSKADNPKADNARVLRPYSKSMRNLLKRQAYNSGRRPSEHVIGSNSFLKMHSGSIMPNVIELEQYYSDEKLRLPENMLRIANTKSSDFYSKKCREVGETPHPARMQMELVDFFIEFLTDEGDLVLDPFGGSNTTGYCAEKLNRKWISIEKDVIYGKQSLYRFQDPDLGAKLTKGEKWNELA